MLVSNGHSARKPTRCGRWPRTLLGAVDHRAVQLQDPPQPEDRHRGAQPGTALPTGRPAAGGKYTRGKLPNISVYRNFWLTRLKYLIRAITTKTCLDSAIVKNKSGNRYFLDILGIKTFKEHFSNRHNCFGLFTMT